MQFARGRLSLVTISFYALSILFGPVVWRNLPWRGLFVAPPLGEALSPQGTPPPWAEHLVPRALPPPLGRST